MRIFTLDCPSEGGTNELYWKVLLFTKKRYAHQWHTRNTCKGLPIAKNFAAAVCDPIEKTNCLGYVLLNDKYLDIDTLVHESTHMAKTFCSRLHRLRDEECLARSVAYFSEALINHFWKARRR